MWYKDIIMYELGGKEAGKRKQEKGKGSEQKDLPSFLPSLMTHHLTKLFILSLSSLKYSSSGDIN